MRLRRERYLDGFFPAQIVGDYHKVDITQIELGQLPGNCFKMSFGKWPDNANEPEIGYQRLMMCGAEALILDRGYILFGFVVDETDGIGIGKHLRDFTMEKWHVGF